MSQCFPFTAPLAARLFSNWRLAVRPTRSGVETSLVRNHGCQRTSTSLAPFSWYVLYTQVVRGAGCKFGRSSMENRFGL